MAQKTIVSVVCDFPHNELVDGTESLSFSIDGSSYEIDLCRSHSAEMRDKLGAFADHARRIVPNGRARKGRVASNRRSPDVREWARQRGYEISERGRIPSKIINAYDAAH